jgi:hypothetical protein
MAEENSMVNQSFNSLAEAFDGIDPMVRKKK